MEACLRLAALQPSVARQFERVLNTIGLHRFIEASEEESRVMRQLAPL